jgi:hypothetical protein
LNHEEKERMTETRYRRKLDLRKVIMVMSDIKETKKPKA